MSKFFLYNGVKLPALPEWDKTVYPYAFIYIVTLDGTTGVYTLVVSSSSVMGYDENGIICPAATVGQRYTVSEDIWAAAADSDDFYIKRDNLIYTVWANFDVLNSDGSIYVAASEPVPVAGKFPLREWLSWRIYGLCSRPLPMGAREPVAWLYNGVRLPGLPEWDVEKYPYAVITKHANGDVFFAAHNKSFTVNEYNNIDGTTIFGYVRKLVDGAWGAVSLFITSSPPIWANSDVLNADGTVYLAASDPVPVYE